MDIQLGIVIPVRNCQELTQDTMASIKSCHTYRLYIVDDHLEAVMKEWLRKPLCPIGMGPLLSETERQ